MSSMTYEARILSDLLRRGGRLNEARYVSEFPKSERPAVRAAIDNLVKKGLVRTRLAGGQGIIEIVKGMEGDAKRIANTIGAVGAADESILGLIPGGYAEPFHISKGGHRVRGHVSTYVYCRSIEDDNDVSCFVVGSQDRVSRIHLGSLADSSSLVSRFLDKIDEAFGTRRFTKEEMKSFGPDLVGNNQPTKAVVDYLCHEDFLVKSEYEKGPPKFERTDKVRGKPAAGASEDGAGRPGQTDEYPFYR